MKKFYTIILIIIAILSLLACSNDLTDENNDINSADFIPKDEISENIDTNNINIGQLNSLLDDEYHLKERLLDAGSIELKDLGNSTIGILHESEKIVTLVDNLFEYKIEKEYVDSQNPEIIGPINFYYSNTEDIYGLMYNKYIYIEGYYFLINKKVAQEIQSLFKSNLASAPINIE